jgi:FkbM family methyltransferase
MKQLLRQMIILGGKIGLTRKYYTVGVKLSKLILPNLSEIKVSNYLMIINPSEDLGLYVGHENSEPGMDTILSSNISVGQVFFDIGAYKGYYSLIASGLLRNGGMVVSIEPNPASFSILEANISRNSINNIIAKNIAIGDTIGKSSFRLNGASSRFGENGDISIDVCTLDYVVEQTKLIPSMIKIDVEGYEYEVIKGGYNTINKYKPILLIEIHISANFALFNLLVSIGYKIGLLCNNGEIQYLELNEIMRKCRDKEINGYGMDENCHIYCVCSN